MICLYCEAENNSNNENCFSCAAPLPKRFDLTKENYDKLSAFVKEVEKRLKNAGHKFENIGLVIIILIFAGAVYLSYFLYQHLEYKILLLILSALILFVLSYMIGAVLTFLFKNSVNKAFTKAIKQDILLYLNKNKIKKSDFKYVVASELNKKSLLIKHINKI